MISGYSKHFFPVFCFLIKNFILRFAETDSHAVLELSTSVFFMRKYVNGKEITGAH